MAEVREPAKQTSIRVETADRLTFSKLASLRDVGMAELFASRDVRSFFRGLLAAELAKESKALAGGKA